MHSYLTIKSGSLCYGDLHNLWYGTTSPIQSFPPPSPEPSGTVKVHNLQPCVPALSGTWNTYQLIDVGNQTVQAWFVCHFTVNPEAEITKILRVSGSPYESYSGSPFNNEETAAEGVLVINRYDWALWDRRGQEELSVYGTTLFDPPFSVGLVDREHAKDQVLQWKDVAVENRVQGEAGVLLYLPESEYLFARFGYNDEHTAARSFLFFTGSTYFMRTSFRGLSRTLRKEETEEQLFLRALDEGDQFEGLKNWKNYGIEQVPLVSECINPFDVTEYLLDSSDWDALREYVERCLEKEREAYAGVAPNGSLIRPFAEPLKENIFALLNDLALTSLMRFVDPLPSASSIQEFVDLLSKQAIQLDGESTMHSYCYKYLTGQSKMDVLRLDTVRIDNRIKSFLSRHCGEHTLIDNGDFITGARQYVVFVFTELLELTIRTAIDNHRVSIVPSDIRLALVIDKQLLSVFKRSKMFWHGRG